MSEWISVEDRLPKGEFDWVLVYADGAISTIAFNKNKGFFEPIGYSCWNISIDSITHWQPLPEPPKEYK